MVIAATLELVVAAPLPPLPSWARMRLDAFWKEARRMGSGGAMALAAPPAETTAPTAGGAAVPAAGAAAALPCRARLGIRSMEGR